MLLNIYVAQDISPQQRIIWLKMSTVPRTRNSALAYALNMFTSILLLKRENVFDWVVMRNNSLSTMKMFVLFCSISEWQSSLRITPEYFRKSKIMFPFQPIVHCPFHAKYHFHANTHLNSLIWNSACKLLAKSNFLFGALLSLRSLLASKAYSSDMCFSSCILSLFSLPILITGFTTFCKLVDFLKNLSAKTLKHFKETITNTKHGGHFFFSHYMGWKWDYTFTKLEYFELIPPLSNQYFKHLAMLSFSSFK